MNDNPTATVQTITNKRDPKKEILHKQLSHHQVSKLTILKKEQDWFDE